ncbi:unnamed protein product [Strongylus vulgaris]|uniref:Uncharacterized protein n=1 Tax=Strongylus vulgaris TaxID=40348 RepID=A0A3P7JAS8_STRVU|nr:unnamed protein product [Strongylus vulgaris]
MYQHAVPYQLQDHMYYCAPPKIYVSETPPRVPFREKPCEPSQIKTKNPIPTSSSLYFENYSMPLPQKHSPSPSFDLPSEVDRETTPSEFSGSSHSCSCVNCLAPPRSKPLTTDELRSLQRFKGSKQVSLRSKHDVLVYSIPGTENAYVFCHDRTNVHYQVFQCVYCWKWKAKTRIKVIGDEFLEDPCKVDHICSPVDELEDRVERLTHKWLMNLREESKFCRASPKEEYTNFLDWLRDDSDEDEEARKKMLKLFKKSGGYKEHRKMFARFCKPKRVPAKNFVEKYIPRVFQDKSEEEPLFELDDSFCPEKIGTMQLLKSITGINGEDKFYEY